MSPTIVPPRRAAPLRAREILALLLGLALVALTARLGVWQLDRAQTKQALAAQIAERGAAPALQQGAAALAFDANVWRQAQVRGEYATAWTVFLQNRQYGEQVGFWVLTPLRIAGTQTYLMVLRGWMPRRFNADFEPDLRTPTGMVTARGRIAPPPSQWFAFAKDPPDAVIRQNVQLAQFAALHHIALLPYVIQQLGDAGDGLVRDWPQPDTGMQTNYGYAVQWFAMSALGLGLTLYFLGRRLRGVPPKEQQT
jgi:cytochrome oxidase assembly protein ShyY1